MRYTNLKGETMVFINDDEFIRGKCPMTKKDIRIITISKMNLDEESNVLDIGSGTGSVTVQCAKISNKGMVYAVEREAEAFHITNENIEKFGCSNVKASKGEAKEYLENLLIEDNNEAKFDSIFIGGSGGDLKDLISLSDKLLKPKGTLVMNFITLDNAYRGIDFIKTMDYSADISLVNISNNRGETYMMIANNPIFIIECRRKGVK